MHSARYLGRRMADQNVTRKLAAILAADVAGYSRLIGTAEEETVRRLNTYREVIDDLFVSHQGRVIGSADDSVVAEFANPVEAVRYAGHRQSMASPAAPTGFAIRPRRRSVDSHLVDRPQSSGDRVTMRMPLYTSAQHVLSC